MHDSLRQHLRRDTEPEHDRLDARVSDFDLGRRDGLAAFLRLHEAAMTALLDAPASETTSAALRELTTRARGDLATRGASLLRAKFVLIKELNPLATDYVLGTSRLGSQVLKARWEDGGLGETGVATG